MNLIHLINLYFIYKKKRFKIYIFLRVERGINVSATNHREVCKKIQSDIPSRNNIPCRRQFEPSICRLNFGKRWRVNRPYRNVAGEVGIISIPVPVARSFTRAHSGVGYFSTLGSKGRGILFGHFFKSITSSWQVSSLGK